MIQFVRRRMAPYLKSDFNHQESRKETYVRVSSRMKQTQSNSVPLVVVEEHHEAFYVWHYGVPGRGGSGPLEIRYWHADSPAPTCPCLVCGARWTPSVTCQIWHLSPIRNSTLATSFGPPFIKGSSTAYSGFDIGTG